MLEAESIEPPLRTPRFTDSTESTVSNGGVGLRRTDMLPMWSSSGSSRGSLLAARAVTAAPTIPRQQPVVGLQESSSQPISRSWEGAGGDGSLLAKEGAGKGTGVGAESATTLGEGETYHCQICLEERPAEVGFDLSACGHTFCRECLQAYVTSKITCAEVYPACFHVSEGFHLENEEGAGSGATAGSDRGSGGGVLERAGAGVTRREESGQQRQLRRRRPGEKPEGCGVVVSPSDIKELLKDDAVTSRTYARFLFFREHRTARECPRCEALLIGDPSTTLEMRCAECGCVFCYEHGEAHLGRSCAEYLESTADETHNTMALIGRTTKPCPGCQTPVEKLGGCNQMLCLHCNTSFCWICMEQVDRGTFPVHFQWWNVRGCPNQQLQEDSQQSPRGRRCHKVLSVLQIIVVGPLAVLLTVASSLACVCCLPVFSLPPRQLFTGCVSGWGNFLTMLPLLPFVFAGAVAAVVVYLVMLPARLLTAISRKWSSGRTTLDLSSSRKSGSSHCDRSSGSTGHSAARRFATSSVGDGGREGKEAGGADDGMPDALERGAINAVDVDVDVGGTVGSSGAATAITSPPPGVSALAILTGVLGPMLVGWQEDSGPVEQQEPSRKEDQGGQGKAEDRVGGYHERGAGGALG